MHRRPRFFISLWVLVLALSAAGIAASAGAPVASMRLDWAYPDAPDSGPTIDPKKVFTLPGSSAHYTWKQIDSGFVAVDWWPQQHPRMPAIVGAGRAPVVLACGYCHLPTGNGRPENAALAGLPASYLRAQVLAMRSGTRRPMRPHWAPYQYMYQAAHAITTNDIAEAVAYFAKNTFVPRTHVVETAIVPPFVAGGDIYRRSAGGVPTTLGSRIIEVADDFMRFTVRDDTVTYTAYVPPGSIAAGRSLALSGRAGVTACIACHGAGLRGSAIAPAIAGRSPSTLFRQLFGFTAGARQTAASAPMRAEVRDLTQSDMIAAAAYAASLR